MAEVEEVMIQARVCASWIFITLVWIYALPAFSEDLVPLRPPDDTGSWQCNDEFGVRQSSWRGTEDNKPTMELSLVTSEHPRDATFIVLVYVADGSSIEKAYVMIPGKETETMSRDELIARWRNPCALGGVVYSILKSDRSKI